MNSIMIAHTKDRNKSKVDRSKETQKGSAKQKPRKPEKVLTQHNIAERENRNTNKKN